MSGLVPVDLGNDTSVDPRATFGRSIRNTSGSSVHASVQACIVHLLHFSMPLARDLVGESGSPRPSNLQVSSPTGNWMTTRLSNTQIIVHDSNGTMKSKAKWLGIAGHFAL